MAQKVNFWVRCASGNVSILGVFLKFFLGVFHYFGVLNLESKNPTHVKEITNMCEYDDNGDDDELCEKDIYGPLAAPV